MKVLMINSVCGIGSTGKICTDIARILEENGDECRIAYGRGNVPAEYVKYSKKIGSAFGVILHTVKSRIFDRTGFSGRWATRSLIRWIKKYDPDVIHLHNIHGYYIHIGILFKYLKSCKKKIIWTMHDCWPITGHCSHFVHTDCDKWQTQCYRCPEKKYYPKSVLFDNSAKNYRKKKELFSNVENMQIVCASQWQTELFKKSFLKGYPIKTLLNGIDLKTYYLRNDGNGGLNSENKTVLGISFVWSVSKGIDVFAELSHRLREYKFVLVGDASNVDKSGFADNVEWIDRISDMNKLAEIYSSADVFVNPTRADVLGLVNIEANACGTPVVVFKTGGCPECIDETSGIVVAQNDVDAMERAIKDICEGNVVLKREDCIKHAALFDKYDKYREYLKLYKE